MGRRATAADYVGAYRAGSTTPSVVARHLLEEVRRVDALDPPLHAFIEIQEEQVLRDAGASSARWERGAPLGPLDGVPIPVKDEFDVAGYATRAGTRFRTDIASTDAVLVERLRRAGAVVFGKTCMTEIGLGGVGTNPGSLTPRNPYDARRFTGGSSSGSAAAVSAGLAPVAVGSDAGGSIRMPAALCGVCGFKGTFGRIPTSGGALLAWSLDHAGPLGATVSDLVAFYDATAGGDRSDRSSAAAPAPRAVPSRQGLSGLRVAYCPELGLDAEPDVVASFERALVALTDAGAVVERVALQWSRWIQRVGYVTIATEAAASQRDWLTTHRDEYNLDTRLLLAVAERFSATEYLHAQRVRTLIREEFARVLERYDVFVNPTLASTARELSSAASTSGEVSTTLNDLVSRYTFAGTLTGFPCLSVPCGRGEAGLPVGFQMMMSPWQDEELLSVGVAVESIFEPTPPPDTEYLARPVLSFGG